MIYLPDKKIISPFGKVISPFGDLLVNPKPRNFMFENGLRAAAGGCGAPVQFDIYATSNRNSTVTMGGGAGYKVQDGQAVTLVADTNIYSVKWYLKKILSPTGNCFSEIWASTGTVGSTAVPTGSQLAQSGNLDVSILTTSFVLYEFIFDPHYTFPAGDMCIMLQYTGGDATNYIQLGLDTTTPTHAGNNFKTETLNSNWATDVGVDTIFTLYKC